MKIRYILVCEDLPENHPHWPNERVYKVKDTKTGLTSLSCSTNKDKIQKLVDKKNAN